MPRRKVCLDGLPDGLVHHAVQFGGRPAGALLKEQGPVEVNFFLCGNWPDACPFQFVFDFDLNRNIEKKTRLFENETGFDFIDNPEHERRGLYALSNDQC